MLQPIMGRLHDVLHESIGIGSDPLLEQAVWQLKEAVREARILRAANAQAAWTILHRAFSLWRAHAQASTAFEQQMGTATARWVLATQAMAFATWAEWTKTQRQSRDAVWHTVPTKMTHPIKAALACAALLILSAACYHKPASKHLTLWLDCSGKPQMSAALLHINDRRLRAAFSAWVAAIGGRRVRRRRASLYLAQLLHATLAACFGAWRQAVMERRAWQRRLCAFMCTLRHQVCTEVALPTSGRNHAEKVPWRSQLDTGA